MMSIAIVGVLAVIIPSIVLIKYRMRMNSAAAESMTSTSNVLSGSARGSRDAAVDPRLGEHALQGYLKSRFQTSSVPLSLPFETFLAGSSSRISLGLLALLQTKLGPFLRTFSSFLEMTSERVTETFAICVVCLPIGFYYFVFTIVSRFSVFKVVRDGKPIQGSLKNST
jgi:hypothetical protein